MALKANVSTIDCSLLTAVPARAQKKQFREDAGRKPLQRHLGSMCMHLRLGFPWALLGLMNKTSRPSARLCVSIGEDILFFPGVQKFSSDPSPGTSETRNSLELC